MRRLVIDDMRVFNFDADYCRTTDEFRKLYPNEFATEPHYDEVWLDNDMGYEPNTLKLREEVKYLVNEIESLAAEGHKLPIDMFVIHTSNHYAGAQMYEALKKWYNVRIERNTEQYVKRYDYGI